MSMIIFKKLMSFVLALVALFTCSASADVKRDQLLVFHMDFNIIQMRRDLVMELLNTASKSGYNAILWEIENKVMLPSIAPAISPDAFSQEEFKEILSEADKLGLESIPLMQTFGHGEYIMNCPEYRHFRERADKSDCYCVSKKSVREFQLALLRDYIDLFGSRLKRFHLGGDEAYWFGSCPVCKKRDRMELYVEHLEVLSKELRSRGIRPGVWHDFLLDKKCIHSKAKLPDDYTVWYWDYSCGSDDLRAKDSADKIAKLSSSKYELIMCATCQSWGDDPFFVDARFHRMNITGLGAIARDKRYTGFCLTSWSIRQSLKRLQRPLIEYAAKRFLDPSPDSVEDWKKAVQDTFGSYCTPEMVDELFVSGRDLINADSRQWSGLKEGIPPPEGWFKNWCAKNPAKAKNIPIKAKSQVERTKRALDKWKAFPEPNDAVKLAIRAGEIKIKQCEMIVKALKGEEYYYPISEVTSLYSLEQSPRSAENSAKLVLGFFAR